MVDMTEYRGRTAVITGAASGMGLCASQKLCAAGATVVMCDINAEALEKCAAEINAKGPGVAWPCVTDVRKFADAQKAADLALAKTGRIDLLIPFAGGWEPRMRESYKPFFEQPVEVIDWGLDVNLRGPVYFARACMPAMVRAKKGVICCIGSTDGFESSASGPMYGTSKSGLFNFVKGLAQAGASFGVRAFCVAPGPVMTRPGMANMQTLLRTQAEPWELVDFILFLASDCCRCITGSTHVMDCGRLSMKPEPPLFGAL